MTLTRTQKKWAVGGGLGAVALVVGYKYFYRPVHHGLPAGRPHGHHKQPHGENARGEYGHGHKHHHKEHGHG